MPEQERLEENRELLRPFLGTVLVGCRVWHSEVGPSYAVGGVLRELCLGGQWCAESIGGPRSDTMLEVHADWDAAPGWNAPEFIPDQYLGLSSVRVCDDVIKVYPRFAGGITWYICRRPEDDVNGFGGVFPREAAPQ